MRRLLMAAVAASILMAMTTGAFAQAQDPMTPEQRARCEADANDCAATPKGDTTTPGKDSTPGKDTTPGKDESTGTGDSTDAACTSATRKVARAKGRLTAARKTLASANAKVRKAKTRKARTRAKAKARSAATKARSAKAGVAKAKRGATTAC